MAGKVSLEEAIWTDPSTKLSFLPVISVSKFRIAYSSEVLGSDPLKKLFEQLRESYDYVVVDLPPLAPIVDVRAGTHLVDSFVFVIEWGRTKIDVVQHALEHARGVYDNLLGVVLNKVDMNIVWPVCIPSGRLLLQQVLFTLWLYGMSTKLISRIAEYDILIARCFLFADRLHCGLVGNCRISLFFGSNLQ